MAFQIPELIRQTEAHWLALLMFPILPLVIFKHLQFVPVILLLISELKLSRRVVAILPGMGDGSSGTACFAKRKY